MYAKMGGTPWTVAHDLTVDDEVVVGMGNVELTGSRFEQKQRFMGITTVFRGDGNYLLSNVSRVCRYDEYPAVLEASMAEVLREVKKRNGWQDHDTVRVVFHAHKPLRQVEVAKIVERCVKEVGAGQSVQFAFLTVTHDHPFKVLDTSQAGKATAAGRKGVYAPGRGTIVQLGRYTRLLTTNGVSQIKRVTSPLPSPLLIHLHRESTYVDLQYLPEQALKFTSLTWRSTQPAYAPVTIYYSELIAELLSRLEEVPDWSPAVLNTKLRSSRWFL
jgi:Piwi domain